MGVITPTVAAISGAAGLGSSIFGSLISSRGQKSANQSSMDFNYAMQKDAQAYNTQMYHQQLQDQESIYNKYQSPQAVAAQLRAAGVNPASVLGSKGAVQSMPSVPSVGASPAASVQLGNEMQSFGDNLPSMVESASRSLTALLSTRNQTEQTQQSIKEMQSNIDLLTAKLGGQILLNQQQKLLNSLTSYFEPTQRYANIYESYARAWSSYAAGDLSQADAALKGVLTEIAHLDEKEKQLRLPFIIPELQATIDLLKVKATTEKSLQASNYASAALSNAQTATENKLRPLKEKLSNQELSNLKESLKGIRYDNIDKILDSLDKAFGTDKGVGSYIKSIIVGIDKSDREQFVRNLMEFIEK